MDSTDSMIIRNKDFFVRDAFTVAMELVGKILHFNGNELRITETECYIGEEDEACHARFGPTPRTLPLYEEGGIAYVYLIYGMYNLLNVVTGEKGYPQAVLIRACKGYVGPGRLTKYLGVTREQNTESFVKSNRLYLIDDGYSPDKIIKDKRVGIDYAGEIYKNKLWRFIDGSDTFV